MNDNRCVTLTVRDQKRLMLIVEVDAGRLTAREAAEVLGLSLRQTSTTTSFDLVRLRMMCDNGLDMM